MTVLLVALAVAGIAFVGWRIYLALQRPRNREQHAGEAIGFLIPFGIALTVVTVLMWQVASVCALDQKPPRRRYGGRREQRGGFRHLEGENKMSSDEMVRGVGAVKYCWLTTA